MTMTGQTFADTVNVTADNGTVAKVTRVNDTTIEVIVNFTTAATTTSVTGAPSGAKLAYQWVKYSKDGGKVAFWNISDTTLSLKDYAEGDRLGCVITADGYGGQITTGEFTVGKAAEQSPVVDPANPFTDVSDRDDFKDAVLWAVGKGITNGTTPTTFSPNNHCTRGQIVTFIYRQLK